MAIALFILTVLVAVVCFVLVDINSKIPPRDYGEEALWRDRRRKKTPEPPKSPEFPESHESHESHESPEFPESPEHIPDS